MATALRKVLVCTWALASWVTMSAADGPANGNVPALADRTAAVFTLRDHLRRHWRHELVFFPVAESLFGRDGLTLLGPDESPVVYQWVPGGQATSGKNSIAFCATVSEFAESTYRLVEGRPARDTDLRIAEDDNSASLENRLIGIKLGGPAAMADGPIAGIRLPSGRWVGGGRLKTPRAAERCSVHLTARGPVFAEVLVSYRFGESGSWRLKFRVIAEEPVVLVDEEFSLPEGSAYLFRPGEGWDPRQMFYRDNGNTCRLLEIAAVAGDTAFRLRAWPTWWAETPEAHWTALCDGRADDMLMIGCREPGAWVEPDRTRWDTTVTISKSNLEARFQLRGFRRKWMLAGLRKSEAVGDEGKRTAPLPQQYLIRHGGVPLDAVKDYVLKWDDRTTRHPGLFLTEPELAQFRRGFQVDEKKLLKLRAAKVPLYRMDDHVAYYLATGDVPLGRNLAEAALQQVQGALDGFVRQDALRNQGSSPHHRTRPVMHSAILSDLALAPDVLTPPQRTRLKAQLALLGYMLASPTFHSPERGYSANPNMTTSARGMLGLVACCIPKHPHARDWARFAVDEIDRELATWCGPGGGWLEAPHYMTVSMDAIVPVSMARRGTGFTETEWLYHPQGGRRGGAANCFPRPAPCCGPTSPATAKRICTTSRARCTSITITTRARSFSGARAGRCAKTSATTAGPRPPITAASTTACRSLSAAKGGSASSPPEKSTTFAASGPDGTARSCSSRTTIPWDRTIS